MSKLLNLFPAIAEKQYFQNSETKEFWFHATAVCSELGFQNPGRTLDMYCDEDEKFQEIVNGRVVWFVSEAGCYGLAMAAKTDKAKVFKRWLKHEVLPKLRASGGYIMPTATSNQLEALQGEISDLQEKVELLKSDKFESNLIESFLNKNVQVKTGKYIMSGELYKRFTEWTDVSINKDVFFTRLDAVLKSNKLPKSRRIHIDKNNGCGDIENAVFLPVSKMQSFHGTTANLLGE
jgi:prophage antirepressor-like protein